MQQSSKLSLKLFSSVLLGWIYELQRWIIPQLVARKEISLMFIFFEMKSPPANQIVGL